MESMTVDSEWADLDSELLSNRRGKRRQSKRIKNIIIAVIAVGAIILIIGLSVGLAMKGKDIVREEVTVTEWLKTQCAHTEEPPSCPWKRGNPLLVLTMGGFRADYVERKITPVLNKLRSCGVRTPYLRPVYPTNLYPNEYTIVTGLYPESHGIVNDDMYDPQINQVFNGTESNPAWWKGEPIWVTAKRQGKKVASCRWVGSDVFSPEFQCDGSESDNEMIDKAIDWLLMPENKRPDLITLSFDKADEEAHFSGIESPETFLAIKTMDDMIGKLMAALYRKHLDNCVNIVIVSDHGMTETSCLRQISLDYYMEDAPEWLDILKFDGTSGSIYTDYKQQGEKIVKNEDTRDLDISDVAEGLSCMSPHLKIYTDDTIPVRHHYGNSDRIGNIVLDVEDTWLVIKDELKKCSKGNHGYDEQYPSMHAFFLAHGPDLKDNIQTEPFEIIELYNLMAELLKITPAPNNGTAGTLNHILRDVPKVSTDGVALSMCSGNNDRQSSCKCDKQGNVYNAPTTVDINTLPFGMPINQGDVNVCILYGRQFTVMYSSDNKQPLSSSYRLTAQQAENFKTENSTCSVPDKRLSDGVNPDCVEYKSVENNIEAVHLFDPGFSTTEEEITESYLSSNIVPMYSEFKDDTWRLVWSLVKEYAVTYKHIHITVGPIFDRNHDGRADGLNHESAINVGTHSDVPIPTHFYIILTKCSNHNTDINDCGPDDLDILSLVLPHVRKNRNCESDAAYLKSHVVRIRDIELLTGLRILTKFEDNTGARKRTYLPPDIWPSSLLAHWSDLPCDESNTCDSDYTPLLLISFDGFRADYLNRKLTPTIEKLRTCGVRTPYMRSMYPTETYPNHYTIVTGLYPESHGIVENYMYDSKINATFDEYTELNPDWWQGEPIWVTAKKQGKQSASMQWFGDSVEDPNKQPSITSNLGNEEEDTFGENIDQILRWVSMDEKERPEVMTLYMWQPDEQGHEFGPNSPEVNDLLKYMDSLIQQLMDGLFRIKLHNCVNIIIVSDHGMAEESCKKLVTLKPYYPELEGLISYLGTTGIINTNYRHVNSSVIPNINAPSGEEVLEALECKNKNFEAFIKDTLPVRYHYRNNERIGNVMLDANDAWMIRFNKSGSCNGKGNHGYDPAYKSMRAIFLAHGPAFKQNFEAEPFENVELYNLMSRVIGMKPAPNNGTFGSLDYILRRTPEDVDREPVLGIDHCSGAGGTRTSTCNCDRDMPNIPTGDHTYHGGLALQEPKLSVCSLTNSLFATIYSKDNKQPAMVSFLITPKQVNINPVTSVDCVVPDIKLTADDNPDCDSYTNPDKNITHVQLFNPGFATTTLEKEETELSSNLVPMYSGFHTRIWGSVMSKLSHYAVRYKSVHVSIGPVFDRNYDGIADVPGMDQIYVKDGSTVPVPTHYFIILLKCQDEGTTPDDCPTENIDILSFVLPHVSAIPNCRSFNFFLKKNVVRLRDIELLTGFKFLTEAEWKLAARKRTHLPTGLWAFD